MTAEELIKRYAAGERNFSWANLYGANLTGAVLYGANLYGANFTEANLYGAVLTEAVLTGAVLTGANLYGAVLTGAVLSKTCLDPRNAPPTDDDIRADGLELRGNQIWGWRTRQSKRVGSQRYDDGRIYEAPYFSWDATTNCHPGLYFSGREWLRKTYGKNARIVQVVALRHDVVRTVGGKWRAKRLLVVPGSERWTYDTKI